jgi:hypothetical protein
MHASKENKNLADDQCIPPAFSRHFRLLAQHRIHIFPAWDITQQPSFRKRLTPHRKTASGVFRHLPAFAPGDPARNPLNCTG